MIVGIGIDTVEIDRFIPWFNFCPTTLLRIFSQQELNYILSTPHIQKQAERIAARFAVREAFYKALHQYIPHNRISFLALCKHIAVGHTPGMSPKLIVAWPSIIEEKNHYPHVHLSITHSTTTATAVVILESTA